MDRIADLTPFVYWPLAPFSFDDLHGSVEGDPRHDFRMHEILPWAANFPNALVGLIPIFRQPFEQLSADAPTFVERCQSRLARLKQRIEHFAVDIELQLLVGRVADANRLGVFV